MSSTSHYKYLYILLFIIFCPSKSNATDVSDAYVYKMKTSFGTVKVLRDTNTGSLDKVMLNGKVIMNNCCHVGLYKKYQLPEGIAILAGVNAVGSNTPYNDDYYIVLKPSNKPVVLTDKDFVALYKCNWNSSRCTDSHHSSTK